MPRPEFFQNAARRLAVLAVAGGLLALAAWQLRRGPEIIADDWRARLAALSTGEAVGRIRAAPRLGPAGWELLLAGLEDGRPEVAAAARSGLDGVVDSLLAGGDGEATQRFIGLLADRGEPWAATARQPIADAALRVLLAPASAAVEQRTRLIVDCERVLRSARAASADDVAAKDATSSRGTLSPPSGDELGALASLPGGGLPWESAPENPTPPAVPLPTKPPAVDRPAPLDPVDGAKPLSPEASQPPAEFRPDLRKPVRRLPIDMNPPDQAAGGANGTWRAAGTLIASPPQRTAPELVRALDAAAPADKPALLAELGARGYGPPQIEVARRLLDPNAAVRREWTNRLPLIGSFETGTWLLWLSHDADAEVRLAALTLLATTNNPDSQARVRQAAREDGDPRIQQLLKSLGE